MTSKEILAKLASDMKKPKEDYIKTEATAELIGNPELLMKVEQFYLPEIIRVICNEPQLLAQFGSKYLGVAPFYCEDTTIEAVLERIKDKTKESTYYINYVFPYVSEEILDNFIFAHDKLKKQIRTAEEEIKKQKESKTRKDLEDRLENYEKKLSELRREEEHARAENDEEKLKEIKKQISNQKSYITKAQNTLKKQEKNLLETERALQELVLHERRLMDVFSKARTIKGELPGKLSEARQKAYTVSDEKWEVQRILIEVICSEEVPPKTAEKFTEASFADRVFAELASNFSIETVRIIAKLYENNLIDIYDKRYMNLLNIHADNVCAFFVDAYITGDGNGFKTDAPDFESWINFVVDSSFFVEEIQCDCSRYENLWLKIPAVACWRTIANIIYEKSEERLADCIAKLLLRINGKSRKHLINLAMEMTELEMLESISCLVSALVDNHTHGDDSAALVEFFVRKIENEKNRIKSGFERMKFKENSLSSKAYCAFSGPMDALEMLATNLATGIDEVSPKLVSQHLKKSVVELFKALEIVNIFPLEDPEDWSNQRRIKFSPECHAINHAKEVKNVYLRTLGFSYFDVEGKEKKVPAVVGEFRTKEETVEKTVKTKDFRQSHRPVSAKRTHKRGNRGGDKK